MNNESANKCRIDGSNVEHVISFGKQPLANNFLSPDEFAKEYFFDLEVGFSENSKMVQLISQPDPKSMFHGNYAFFSGTSKAMGIHFESFANDILSRLKEENPFIVELGCNDGILLQHIQNKNIRHLGVEPSTNVAEVAKQKGINVISDFFSKTVAEEIKKTDGPASAILAANVMCHIPDFNSVIEGMNALLSKNGIISFEDPYLGDVVTKTSYDQFYDEHVYLFSLHSISYAFEKHGFEVFDVMHQNTHGGSMRYYICRKGEHTISPKVSELFAKEKNQQLDNMSSYLQFAKNCEKSKVNLIKELTNLKKNNKKVCGYAATSKSTTVLNYCQIGPDLIPCIYDTTPIKIGKFSPGMHIPIENYANFSTDYPNVAVLFGWNHEKEILAKEEAFMTQGGKWLLFVPEVFIK